MLCHSFTDMFVNHKYKFLNLIMGVFIALITIWAIGIFFCRNYVPIEYCNELSRNVYRPGITILSSREGFAFTKCGKAGLIAPGNSSDIDKNAVLLFGNSFAEGLHVPDQSKMHRVANKLLAPDGKDAPTVYNVAMSSQLFSDTLWQLPKYLEQYGNNLKGIIVIVMSHDLLPSSVCSQYGSSLQNNAGQLIVVSPTPASMTNWGMIKYRFCLNAFLALGKSVKDSISDWYSRTWHRIPYTQAKSNVEAAMEKSVDANLDNYLEWQLAKLREITDLPILILCCIDKPIRTVNGIEAPQAESELAQKIKLYSEKNHLDFYSMREDFRRLYDQNLIVCGFPNTLPGAGHFSIYAHQALGEIMADWCRHTFMVEAKQ